MKIITNRQVVQKIVIAIVIVILTTFCIPTISHADTGGKLMSPIVNFVVAIFDGVQFLLESTMLGRTASLMSEVASDYKVDSPPPELTDDDDDNDDDIKVVNDFMDAKWWGIDAINIPTITYTPEEIFSNRVPALDINFINPSITKSADGLHDSEVQERNVALQLRGIIASWYNALTIIAMVGLLSVLVYLGIRMLLSSIAADRAKYKQMLMDWVIAMCLLFTLHFIMSFVLTAVETVTAMISSSENNSSITVYATKVQGALWDSFAVLFKTNLMSYVRFMVQAGDLNIKLAFMFLYIMLVIYSVRFTWVYLKRVINMAFLTLIAPMVALTYPIDKVSDGKAQAFNMWLKEFIYNALVQPIHLLLYKILLGSAIEIAVDNALYAIAALGFIIAAEKMVKQMFGFGKASGGTVASLAGAAGVTALAGKFLNNAGKNMGGSGGNGKVRTKNPPERQGRNANANKPFQGFRDPNRLVGAGATSGAPGSGGSEQGGPLPGSGGSEQGGPLPGPGGTEQGGPLPGPGGSEQGGPLPGPGEPELSIDEQLANERAGMTAQDYRESGMSPQEWEENRRAELEAQRAENVDTPPENTQNNVPSPEEYNNPFAYEGPLEPDNFFDVVRKDTAKFGNKQLGRLKNVGNGIKSLGTAEGKRNLKNRVGKTLNNAAIGAWKAAPAAVYKLGRGGARLGAGALMAGAGLAIGATTGNGEQALSMAAAAGTGGFTIGDNIFDAVAKKAGIENPGGVIDKYRDAYGTSKYGNAIDARNARADKEYLKSQEFNEFYEKEFEKKYDKDEFKKMVTSYRESGITDPKDIKNAIKLEEYYSKKENNPHGLQRTEIRQQVQNIVSGYNQLDSTQKRAFSGDKKAEEALRSELLVMLGGDSPENRAYVDTIYQGYKDYRTQT